MSTTGYAYVNTYPNLYKAELWNNNAGLRSQFALKFVDNLV
ncbi:MAG: hypothetical protein V7L11_11455 [Nostoc sp.]